MTNLRVFVSRYVDEWLAGSLDATSAMGCIRDALKATDEPKALHDPENRCVECYKYRNAGAIECGNCNLKF